MILEDVLSRDISQHHERLRYLPSNTNTDANYSDSNSQYGSLSNRSSRSSSSAMRGLESSEEQMISSLSQTELQANLLSYKGSHYSHSHRSRAATAISSSTRGDSKSSSKYGQQTSNLNELAVSAKKSILRNLQQLMPEQSLNDSLKYTTGQHHRKSFDDCPSGNVAPQRIIIPSTNNIHRRSFDDVNIFKSSHDSRSLKSSPRELLTTSFDSYNTGYVIRSESIGRIDAQKSTSNGNESHQKTYSLQNHDYKSGKTEHKPIDLNLFTLNQATVDTDLNDSLMVSPLNIHDISMASDAFSSNDSYDRMKINSNHSDEVNDTYGIAMRNLGEYADDKDENGDGYLDSEDVVCSV